MFTVYSISILSILLVGFSAGRRVGIKEGFEKGIRAHHLKLKEELFQKPYCPLCHKLH